MASSNSIMAPSNSMMASSSIKTEDGTHVCSQCGQGFSSEKQLSAHVHVIHQFDPAARFACKRCDRKFLNDNGLLQHTKIYHPKSYEKDLKKQLLSDLMKESVDRAKQVDGGDLFPCQWSGCREKFTARWRAQEHYRRVHEGPFQTVWWCPYCFKKMPGSRDTSEHVRRVHDRKIYRCILCDKSHTHRHNLKVHLLTKHIEK